MIKYTNKNPTFSESILVVEPDDEVSAENNNAAPEQLIQNDLILAAVLNPDLVTKAFENSFPGIKEDSPEDSESMSTDEIANALNTEWNGESSEDPYALSATSVEDALNTEWNGESSSDPNAMNAEEVSEAIENA